MLWIRIFKNWHKRRWVYDNAHDFSQRSDKLS